MTQTVSSSQRFKRYGEHCPICEGHANLKPGRGERCAGYLSDNGEYAFCTREEYAGNLELDENTQPPAFCHKMYGHCNCGVIHNPARESSNGHTQHEKKAIAAEYSYLDEHGRLAYQTVRYEPKNFIQRRPDGNKWVYKEALKDVTRIPYRLPELLKASLESIIYINEGEKAADAAAHLGVIATTNVCGAGNWTESLNKYFKGRHVVILPDNDPKGQDHAKKVAKALTGYAATIRILELPGLPEKGDICEWIAAGGTKEELERLYQPSAPVTSGVLFSEIQEKEINWLWEGWIPRGKITMEDGMPDQGKSILSLDLIARVTRGDFMPDFMPGVKGAAIIVAAEDDASDTIKPRLLASHADVSKVINLSSIRERNAQGDIEERPFTLPRDLPILEEEIKKYGVVLIVLDPLMAILDSQLKSKDDQDVRQALTPLARLLERTECACVIIRHFNKTPSDNALLRGAGSMGIIGAARSGLIVVPDPDDQDRHVLALAKHNLSKRTDNLVYRIVSDSFGRPKIEWEGTSQHTTAELLSTSKPSAGRQEIVQLLKDAAEPLGPKDIVEASTLSYDRARQLLSRMMKDGTIISVARGKYIMSQSSQTSQSSQVSQSSQTTTTTFNTDGNMNCDSGNKECHNSEIASEAFSAPFVTDVTLVTAKNPEARASLAQREQLKRESAQRQIPPEWLRPGTHEWEKQVKKNGLADMQARRAAWFERQNVEVHS